jgi:hypothetical protein
MRTPEADKAAKKDLLQSVFVCFVLGIGLIPICAWLRFRTHFPLNVTTDTVPVSKYIDLVDSFTFEIVPALSLMFIIIGYSVWQAYRRLYRD